MHPITDYREELKSLRVKRGKPDYEILESLCWDFWRIGVLLAERPNDVPAGLSWDISKACDEGLKCILGKLFEPKPERIKPVQQVPEDLPLGF